MDSAADFVHLCLISYVDACDFECFYVQQEQGFNALFLRGRRREWPESMPSPPLSPNTSLSVMCLKGIFFLFPIVP